MYRKILVNENPNFEWNCVGFALLVNPYRVAIWICQSNWIKYPSLRGISFSILSLTLGLHFFVFGLAVSFVDIPRENYFQNIFYFQVFMGQLKSLIFVVGCHTSSMHRYTKICNEDANCRLKKIHFTPYIGIQDNNYHIL